MGFIQPLLLTLGIAAAVPILLHLLQRHQGPRVIFPALRYLRRAEREHAKRIRLRQVLLLVLRVAAIALLAAAAARPFIRASGDAHSPTAVAIVLDNSMSSGVVSGDERVLDQLKARALETLAQGDPQDRFWLVRAGSPWEPAWPGDARATADRVRETVSSGAAADIPGAVERARSILEAGAGSRSAEIHLLTDLQASALTGTVSVRGGPMALLVWSPGEPPPPNRSVADVEIGGGAVPTAGIRTTAAVTVTGEEDSTVTVRLAIDGRIVGAATPASGAAAVMALPPLPAGTVTGFAETDPDALRADDRRYFAVRVAEAPRVAATADLGLADDALGVLEASGRIRRSAVADADVVLSAGFAAAAGIRNAATVLVLPPASEAELPGVNRRLADAGIPWRYGSPSAAGESRMAVEVSDPLHAHLASVRLFEVWRLETAGDRSPGDSVLLRTEDGAPWVVRVERRDGGRFLLLASSLSEAASTLPSSAALVPLLDRLIGAWALSASAPAGLAPGSEVGLPASITHIEQPDGTIEAVTPGSVYRLGPEPGVYRLLSGEVVVEALAVNPPAAESVLRRADRADLDAVFAGYDITVARESGWTRSIFRSRLGSDVWRTVILAAITVLIAEAVIAGAGARASSRSAAPPVSSPGTGAPAADGRT